MVKLPQKKKNGKLIKCLQNSNQNKILKAVILCTIIWNQINKLTCENLFTMIVPLEKGTNENTNTKKEFMPHIFSITQTSHF